MSETIVDDTFEFDLKVSCTDRKQFENAMMYLYNMQIPFQFENNGVDKYGITVVSLSIKNLKSIGNLEIFTEKLRNK